MWVMNGRRLFSDFIQHEEVKESQSANSSVSWNTIVYSLNQKSPLTLEFTVKKKRFTLWGQFVCINTKRATEVRTSADSLFLSWQDTGRVDDADALKNLIGHLRADKPEHTQRREWVTFPLFPSAPDHDFNPVHSLSFTFHLRTSTCCSVRNQEQLKRFYSNSAVTCLLVIVMPPVLS